MESQTNSVKEEIQSIETQTAQLFSDIKESEESTEQKREQQTQSSQLLSGCKSDIEVLRSRIEHNCESIKRIESEIDELTEKIYELDDSLSEKDDNYTLLIQKDTELDESISKLSAEIEGLESEFIQQNEKTEQIGAEIIEKLNEIASIRSKNGNYNALIDSFEARKNAISREIDDKKESFEALEKSVATLEAELAQKNNSAKELTEKSNELSVRIKAEQDEFFALQKQRQQMQIKAEQAQSRFKLLCDMEKSFDNYSKSVKNIMQAHKNKELKNAVIFGTVAQLVKVPEELSTAIETALGASAQNIVTQTESDAKTAIEYLKRTNSGRATFLPVSAARSSTIDEKDLDKNKGYIGIASSLISFDNSFDKVIGGLLGRVVVVDSIDNAILMAKKYNYKFRIVTKEGELLTPGGAMSGGSKQGGIGLFARANELEALQKQIKELSATLEELQSDEQNRQSRLSESALQSGELAEQLRKLQDECIALSAEHKHSTAFSQSLNEARATLISEQEQINEKINEMSQSIKRNNDAIELLNSETAVLEKQTELHKQSGAERMRLREEKTALLLNLKMEQSGVKKDIELHNEKTELVKSRKQEIASGIEQRKQNINEIEIGRASCRERV